MGRRDRERKARVIVGAETPYAQNLPRSDETVLMKRGAFCDLCHKFMPRGYRGFSVLLPSSDGGTVTSWICQPCKTARDKDARKTLVNLVALALGAPPRPLSVPNLQNIPIRTDLGRIMREALTPGSQ